MRARSSLFSSCCVIALFSVTGVAAAQQSETQSDVVIVTANKRTENVQEVPKSVSVVSQELLERASVQNIQDLARVSPSIAGNSIDLSPPAIRGISTVSIAHGVQQKTGVVLDDVPLPPYSTLANELSDVERVEVLPGPQSSISGRNAAGGLINVVTRAPSRTFTGSGSAETTSDDQTRVTLYVSGPISDTLAFSLSGYSNKWDGNVLNRYTDSYLNSFDNTGVRGKLLWAPSDDLSITLTGFTTRSHTERQGLVAGGVYTFVSPGAQLLFALPGETFSSLFPGVVPSEDNNEVSTPRKSYQTTSNNGGSLRVDYDTAFGTLTSISFVSDSKMPRLDNLFAMPLEKTIFVGSTYDGTASLDSAVEYKSQEFRLTSNDNDQFRYLLGLIYTDTDIQNRYLRASFGNPNWRRNVTLESIAAFGRATWDFQQGTSVTGGLRFQSDDLGYKWDVLPLPPAVGQTFTFRGSSENSFWSGEVSLRHEFTDDVNAYVTLAQAESGEAYDTEDAANAFSRPVDGLQPIPAETVKNIEIGVKSQWLDRRLTANFNAFYANYENYQVQTIPPANDPNALPIIRLFAVGEVSTKGLEFTGSFRATDQLQFSLNAAWINAEIENYENAGCYAQQTVAEGCVTVALPGGGTQAVQRNLAGNTMPNTPEFAANVSANYDIPLPSLPFDGELGAFYRWQSETETYDILGNPRLKQGSYGVLNLSAAIRDREGRYRIEAFVNNVFDENYYASRAQETPLSGVAFTAAYARDSFRFYGVRMGVDF